MIVGLVVVPVAFLFAAIWPWIQYGLAKFGHAISKDGWSIGDVFFYGIFNRLLHPFGLHHILNTFLWFQLPIEGVKVAIDGAFDPSLGVEVAAGDINCLSKRNFYIRKFSSIILSYVFRWFTGSCISNDYGCW